MVPIDLMTTVHAYMHLLQDHYRECAEYPVKCERCSSEVKKSLMEDHLEEHCPIIVCPCGEQVWCECKLGGSPGVSPAKMRSKLTIERDFPGDSP